MHMVKPIQTSRPSLSDLIVSDENEGAPKLQVRVKASILPANECDRFCLCQCHHTQSFASPAIFASIIGRLFVGYTGFPLLNRRSCDRVSCKHGKGRVHVQIAYLFPLWFFLRLITLTVTQMSSTFLWRLKFPVITQSISPNLVYASLGRIDSIQALLSANTASLNTIDAIGSKSPLHVSTTSISM